jgi:hypothetical protein
MNVTKWEDIPTWQSLAKKEETETPEVKNLRFAVNEEINNKIRVWYGT